jgi:hypothetical protein
VNFRPEYRHDWGGRAFFTQLRVDPLEEAGAEELLTALLGDDAGLGKLKAALIARAEGTPLYLEESVRTLVETGVLEGERGAYRLARETPELEMPPTIHAIIAARIDRLAPEAKRLLQCAAVVGKDVPLAVLREVAGEDEDSLRRGLAELQAAEFLFETSLFPVHEFSFKHGLTHEVAHGGLLQDQRRRGDGGALFRAPGRARRAAGRPFRGRGSLGQGGGLSVAGGGDRQIALHLPGRARVQRARLGGGRGGRVGRGTGARPGAARRSRQPDR